MTTEQPQDDGEKPLSSDNIRRLENGLLYALAASSSKLKVPPGTRIWDLYERTLADLYINSTRREWMWDHIDYAIKLTKGAKKVDRSSKEAKAAENVKDVWAVVLAKQPGKPRPEDKPVTQGDGNG